MNGRIYDPMLRRFVSPDNYVQDPYNTQSYNRYAYVWNNPLMYTDPSGEFIQYVLAAVGLLGHIINNVMNGVPWYYGVGKRIVMDGLSMALSFGIGAAVGAAGNFAKEALRAGLHGIAGGLMSSLESGSFKSFGSGFASGAVSSLVSSGVQALGNSGGGIHYESSETMTTGTITKSFAQKNPILMKAIMITSGGLSGGFSSAIAGGNFWQGFKQGVIVAGLNHAVHEVVSELQNGGKKRYVFNDDKTYQDYIDQGEDGMALVKYKKGLMLSQNGKASLEVWNVQEVYDPSEQKWYKPNANQKANCYGHALTGGKYIVNTYGNDEAIGKFLMNDGYRIVSQKDIKPFKNNDILQFEGHVIYRQNNLWHSGLFGIETSKSTTIGGLSLPYNQIFGYFRKN